MIVPENLRVASWSLSMGLKKGTPHNIPLIIYSLYNPRAPASEPFKEVTDHIKGP